jgi:multidrug efflux pump subunit AcrA (membrane-fusion protein)
MSENILLYEQFLSRTPTWLMRRGTLILLIFFMVLLGLAFFIKYNEVINAEILVTGKNPPVDLYSKKNGKLIYLNFKPEQMVEKDKVLAVIENPSDYNDIFYLKEKLEDSLKIYSTIAQIYQNFPSNLELEYDIHLSYQSFLKAFQKYIMYLNLNQEELENINLNSRIDITKEQIKIKKRQLLILSRNLDLVIKDNMRIKQLFSKGVVSKQQLENSQRDVLVVQNDLSKISEELEILYIDTLSLENLSRKSFNEDKVNSSVYFSELQLSKQELKGKLEQWKEDYALVSPIAGRITVFDIWNNYQSLKKGEHVLTVLPNNIDNLLGKCKVPIRNSAKLAIGQNVNIKLDNYPYHEWGILKGEIVGISDVPKKGDNHYYVVYVNIPKLITSYGKEIEFKHEMQGNAKIILEKTSLIERVFYQFRSLWTDASI